MSSSNDDEFPSASSSLSAQMMMSKSSPMIMMKPLTGGRNDRRTMIYPPSLSVIAAESSSMIKSSQNVSPHLLIPSKNSSSANSSITPSPDFSVMAMSGAGATAAAGSKCTADSLSLSEPNSFGSYIESYSNFLSTFAYEKAKELAEKQSCQQKTTEPLWSSLALIMSQIALLEKQYMNLSFLAPKGFLRKDSNLKSQYEQTKQELSKLVSHSDYVYFTKDLLFLTTIRMDLIEFYEKLSLLGSAKNVEIGDLLSDVELICEKYSDELKSVGTIRNGSIFQSLGWEIELVFNLLKCHSCTQNWDFFGSIIAIQVAQTQLTEWSDFIQAKQSSKKSSFIKSNSTTPPYLYNWLLKVKAIFLSKLSLYFNEILSKYSNPAFDIRSISTKLQADYYARIASFQKRTDALAVCLVFDARDIKFSPNGYEYPTRVQESPQGIESFPAVLSIPSKPLNRWPSVVMMISDRMRELVADKCVGFFDTRTETTFFVARVDPRMFLLCIYETKKSEKDSYVLKFMQELIIDLKCGKIFSSLKLGAK